jgi:hypothetical protein
MLFFVNVFLVKFPRNYDKGKSREGDDFSFFAKNLRVRVPNSVSNKAGIFLKAAQDRIIERQPEREHCPVTVPLAGCSSGTVY